MYKKCFTINHQKKKINIKKLGYTQIAHPNFKINIYLYVF